MDSSWGNSWDTSWEDSWGNTGAPADAGYVLLLGVGRTWFLPLIGYLALCE